MSLSDNRDYIIEGVELVHPDGFRSQVLEPKYTGFVELYDLSKHDMLILTFLVQFQRALRRHLLRQAR